jgi:hypothetical protein
VVHDQLANRWILTQFTTLGPTYYNCIAVSTTGDATGSYCRYAFSTGPNFPDYPKYGIWPNTYVATTHEFDPADNFAGIGVYGLERAKMLRGNPTARAVSILYPPGATPWITGDGWLPSDLDGNRRPPAGSPNYLVGTQDDQGPYGAPFDAINLFKFYLSWGPSPSATLVGPTQLPVAEFDSDYPCVGRQCIPSPTPTWPSTSSPTGSGRPGGWPTGTSAPMSWMGSIAQGKKGNMALGYSFSSETVYPGIRYTGRLRNDVANQLPQGEGVIVNGSGSQTDPAARWGDYTSMNVDPADNCRFWYVNEYYRTTSARGWQTRIAAFRMPGYT